jgi:hypothetical protein
MESPSGGLPCRKRLFTMINNLPSIYEVVTGTAKKEPKEKTPKSNNKTNKSGSKVCSFFYHISISFDMTTSCLTS